MRLIDAHNLMERLYDANPKGRVELAELIETEPTVDTESVVRCKDCIHRMEDGMCEYKDYSVVAQDDNDFCSWGERREDADE